MKIMLNERTHTPCAFIYRKCPNRKIQRQEVHWREAAGSQGKGWEPLLYSTAFAAEATVITNVQK